MFILIFTKNFEETYTKIIKGNPEIEQKIRKALHFLQQDPHYPSLKTHRTNTQNHGEKWSSWVTGDIRMIWDYDTKERLVIILLDLGRHSGSQKAYK